MQPAGGERAPLPRPAIALLRGGPFYGSPVPPSRDRGGRGERRSAADAPGTARAGRPRLRRRWWPAGFQRTDSGPLMTVMALPRETGPAPKGRRKSAPSRGGASTSCPRVVVGVETSHEGRPEASSGLARRGTGGGAGGGRGSDEEFARPRHIHDIELVGPAHHEGDSTSCSRGPWHCTRTGDRSYCFWRRFSCPVSRW
jgi:hypothetical protein